VGDMGEARSGHTASLLRDGRVLIAGGEGALGVSSTLEIFDPATGAFIPAGELSAPRKTHAAAVLADGRVLVAGGSDGLSALSSTDIFDPATAQASPGPALSTARAAASATTLLDGKVLVAGGSDGTSDLASAEVYDPALISFSATAGGLATARQGHLAFLLPFNNQVLIVGGTSGPPPRRSCSRPGTARSGPRETWRRLGPGRREAGSIWRAGSWWPAAAASPAPSSMALPR